MSDSEKTNSDEHKQDTYAPEEAFSALFSADPAVKANGWRTLVAIALGADQAQATRAQSAILIAHGNDSREIAGFIAQMWTAGQNSQVIELASKLIESNGSQADFYEWRGQSQLRLQQYESAVADLQRAVERAPDYAMGFYWLSNALDGLGDEAEALKTAQQALALAPENALMRINLGWVMYKSGDYPASIAASTLALTLDPTSANSPYAAFNLGLALLASGDEQQASAAYQQGATICAALSSADASVAKAAGLNDLNNLATAQPQLQQQVDRCKQVLEA